MRFHKYEGLGNDFVILDEGQVLGEEEARLLCDRHLGIGADGVLFVTRDPKRMMVINADGSRPEMCGNGLRCVALHLDIGAEPVEIMTDAGPHVCRMVDGELEVEMAVPKRAPKDVPLDAETAWVDKRFELAIDETSHALSLTCVSMGNPHAVTFDDVAETRAVLGPAIERHPRFPAGVNVGFARMDGSAIDLAVFERGVGWTRACGTGACAAAVAAVVTERAERFVPIPVRLPGGTLTITVRGDDQGVLMRGPARHVFSGDL